MKHSAHSAEALPSNVEKLERTLKKLEETAEGLHAAIRHTTDEVQNSKRDARAFAKFRSRMRGTDRKSGQD